MLIVDAWEIARRCGTRGLLRAERVAPALGRGTLEGFLARERDTSVGSCDASQPEAEDKQRPLGQSEPGVRCADCHHLVTNAGESIDVSGKHRHTFVNPHGLVFNIRCFRRAPGCIAFGPISSEWTWFPCYHWQISLCASCGQHLGWHFRSSGDMFYGLIAGRLADGSTTT